MLIPPRVDDPRTAHLGVCLRANREEAVRSEPGLARVLEPSCRLQPVHDLDRTPAVTRLP